MATWKPTNLITSDYTFYRRPVENDNPFTVIYQNRYGWNFCLSHPSNYVLEKVKTGWDITSSHLATRTPLPNFINDYPEFFV